MGDEAAELEASLVAQLVEQRESLVAIAEALRRDAASEELEEMHAALTEAIADTEGALLEMKRSRLLQTFSSPAAPSENEGATRAAAPAGEGVLSAGQRCRFRHTDGLWYTGLVRRWVGEEEEPWAEVDFAQPTRVHHLALVTICADLCRPLNAPNTSDRDALLALEPGDRAWAPLPDGSGLWGRCEVDSLDATNKKVSVHFVGHTRRPPVRLPLDAISISALGSRELDGRDGAGEADGELADAEGGEEGEDDEEEEEDGVEDEEEGAEVVNGGDEDVHLGLGRAALAMVASSGAVDAAASAGPQTDVAHFAEWEGHTRGIASRMMASMGYKRGSGLGRGGRGVLLPLEVRLLKPGTGLGADEGRSAGGGRKKKRKRGGQRGREAKMAQRRRDMSNAARQNEMEAEKATGTPGIFSFINSALGDKSEAASVMAGLTGGRGDEGGDGVSVKNSIKSGKAVSTCDRQQLMSHHDGIIGIQGRLAKLREMLNRNRNDKVIRAQVERKISSVLSELAAAEAERGRAESALKSKDKQKKWMKF